MDALFDWISVASARWEQFASRALTDGTVAFAFVAALWLALRRVVTPGVAYVLFVLVLLKLANPFRFAGPSWLAWLSPATWFASPEPAVAPVVAPVVAPARDVLAIESAAPVWSVVDWLFVGWIVVVAALAVRFCVQQVRIMRIVRAARPVHVGELGVDLGEVCAAARVGRRVRWLVTDAVESPATGGLFRPFVLLPRGLAAAITPAAVRWTLLHELAHVRRADVFVSLVQRVAQIALFFHPLVWWTNRLIDEQREFACDEAALAASGGRRKECGEGFLSVVEWARSRGVRGPAGAMAMFDEKSAIRRRLMNIIERPRRTSRFQRVVFGVLAVGVAAIVLPTGRLEASVVDEVSMQDPGGRAEHERELERLRRRLERLQKRQAELVREIEAFRRAEAGRSGRGVSGKAPAAGGFVILEDVTDATGSAAEEVVIVEEFEEVLEVADDAGDPKADPRRIHVRKVRAPTAGSFLELVEEVPEPAGPGAPGVVFRAREGSTIAPAPARSEAKPAPTRRGQAVIRSRGETRVIDLDEMPGSGVIEIGGETIRYERQSIYPEARANRGRAKASVVVPPEPVDRPAPPPQPNDPPNSRVRRIVWDR